MTNPNIPKTLVELTIDKLIAGNECSKASLDEVRALSKDELKSLITKRVWRTDPHPSLGVYNIKMWRVRLRSRVLDKLK